MALFAVNLMMLAGIHSSRGSISRVREVQAVLSRTRAGLVDAETGQRGFLLTGKQSYLEPYRAAVVSLPIGSNSAMLRRSAGSSAFRDQAGGRQRGSRSLGPQSDRSGRVKSCRQRDRARRGSCRGARARGEHLGHPRGAQRRPANPSPIACPASSKPFIGPRATGRRRRRASGSASSSPNGSLRRTAGRSPSTRRRRKGPPSR